MYKTLKEYFESWDTEFLTEDDIPVSKPKTRKPAAPKTTVIKDSIPKTTAKRKVPSTKAIKEKIAANSKPKKKTNKKTVKLSQIIKKRIGVVFNKFKLQTKKSKKIAELENDIKNYNQQKKIHLANNDSVQLASIENLIDKKQKELEEVKKVHLLKKKWVFLIVALFIIPETIIHLTQSWWGSSIPMSELNLPAIERTLENMNLTKEECEEQIKFYQNEIDKINNEEEKVLKQLDSVEVTEDGKVVESQENMDAMYNALKIGSAAARDAKGNIDTRGVWYGITKSFARWLGNIYSDTYQLGSRLVLKLKEGYKPKQKTGFEPKHDL